MYSKISTSIRNRNVFLLFIFLLISLHGISQPNERNQEIKFPDIPGFMTLKGDFHLHTVFSDGHVWPSFRVREAQKEGLDVISITEHIDYEGFPEEIEYNREKAFEIAQKSAEKTNVLVIRGIEISPRVAPYHNNAIFLENVDVFPYDYMKDTHQKFVMKEEMTKEELMAPFLEVQKQNGFVFYNHPGYKWWDKKDKDLFTEYHRELLSKGILGGVEVVNSRRYNRIGHEMAEKYNLTIFANSDEHHDIATTFEGTHRPMTLVFAKSKTVEDIKEAILNRRTMAYFEDYLIGRQKEAEAFFKASLEITAEKDNGGNAPQLKINIANISDMPYEIKLKTDYIIDNLPLGQITLKSQQTTSILLNPVWEYPEEVMLEIEVTNILVSPENSLKTKIPVRIE